MPLDNNVFENEGYIFKQIRGLAMGSCLSGQLAIIMMDRFERQHFCSRPPQMAFYARCVDDTRTTVRKNKDAEELLTDLNSKHPTIKFELELPDTDGFLPIPDINKSQH